MKYILLIVMICCYGYSYSQVITTHPRILLNSETIAHLQSRAANNTNTWSQIQSLTTFALAQSSAVLAADATGAGRQYVFPLMLSYYATGNTTHRDKAIEIFVIYCNNYTTDNQITQLTGPGRHNEIAELSIAYDWCYPFLSATDRVNIRNRIIAWTDYIITNTSHPGNMAISNYYEGDFALLGNFSALVTAAYAIHSENNTKGNQYLGVINTVLLRIMTFIATRLHNGDANEGWATIGAHSIHGLLRSWAIIKTASVAGIDNFQETLYDQQVIKFLVHATTPTGNNIVHDGDISSLQLYDFHKHVADIISTYSDDAETRQVAKYFSANNIPFSQFKNNVRKCWSFLFFNEEEQSADYKILPSYNTKKVFTGESGTGQFLQRSSWDATAQWFNFKAGGHYGQRASDGQGHFSLFENGWLIIDSNMTTIAQSGIVTQDIARNIMQFTPNNTNTMPLYPTLGFANAEHSQFVQSELTNNYSFFKVNNLPIYAPRFNNTVYAAIRSVLYIPAEKILFVYDEAGNTSPSYLPNFALHFPDSSFTADENNKVIRYSNAQTTMYDHILIPEQITISQGKSNGKGGVRVHPTYRGWRGIATNPFLQCIYTNPNTSGARDITIMDYTNYVTMGGEYGAFFRNTDRNNIVVLHGHSYQYQKDSIHYNIPTVNPTHHILVQLKPNTMYYLQTEYDAVNSITYIELTTENNGGVQYLSSSAGSIEFTTQITSTKIRTYEITTVFDELSHKVFSHSYINNNNVLYMYSEKSKSLRESSTYDSESNIVWLTKDQKKVLPVLWVDNAQVWLTNDNKEPVKHIVDIENATGEIFYIDEFGERHLSPYSIDYSNQRINYTKSDGMVMEFASIKTKILDRNNIGKLRPDQYIAMLIASGCIETPYENEIPFLLKQNDNTTYSSEENSASVMLSPNPVGNELTITLSGGKGTVQLINSEGTTIMEQTINGNNTLDTQELPNGLYIVRIQQDGITINKQIIILK